jgi:hypothetical protein
MLRKSIVLALCVTIVNFYHPKPAHAIEDLGGMYPWCDVGGCIGFTAGAAGIAFGGPWVVGGSLLKLVGIGIGEGIYTTTIVTMPAGLVNAAIPVYGSFANNNTALMMASLGLTPADIAPRLVMTYASAYVPKLLVSGATLVKIGLCLSGIGLVIGATVGATVALTFGLTALIKRAPIYQKPVYSAKMLEEVRARRAHSKSLFFIGPGMKFDLFKTPADPQVIKEIRKQYKLSKKHMPAPLRGDKTYSLKRSQIKHVVPDAMKRFTKTKTPQYRGVVSGMKLKLKAKSKPVDFGIGSKNVIRF